MSFDRTRFQEINAMSVSDLVHTMLVQFNKHYVSDDPEFEGTFLQSQDYSWAANRLDAIFEHLSDRS